MANITRFDPFAGDFENLLEGLFVRPMRIDFDNAQQLKMKLDVAQDDKAYTVNAELPGVKKEDIHVQVDGNRVSISAEAKKETEEKKGTNYICRERYYGKLARSFVLDQDIDASGVQARYSDGVLQLTLPKKAKGSAKSIAVS